jgi:hypothetical protein
MRVRFSPGTMNGKYLDLTPLFRPQMGLHLLGNDSRRAIGLQSTLSAIAVAQVSRSRSVAGLIDQTYAAFVFSAAWDYINYRRIRGRYSRSIGRDLMCGAYVGALPEEIMLILQAGDTILVGNFESWISWLIMYLTNSQISHVAVYVGDGKILHATQRGGEIAPISMLFGKNVRLLPCKAPVRPHHRERIRWENIDNALVQRPYSILLVVSKAIVILSGRDPICFRWRVVGDIVVLAASVILVLNLSAGWYFLVAGYLVLVLINHLRPPPRPDSKFANFYGVPADALRWILRSGGAFMPDPMSPWAQRTIAKPNSPWEANIFRRRSNLPNP